MTILNKVNHLKLADFPGRKTRGILNISARYNYCWPYQPYPCCCSTSSTMLVIAPMFDSAIPTACTVRIIRSTQTMSLPGRDHGTLSEISHLIKRTSITPRLDSARHMYINGARTRKFSLEDGNNLLIRNTHQAKVFLALEALQ